MISRACPSPAAGSKPVADDAICSYSAACAGRGNRCDREMEAVCTVSFVLSEISECREAAGTDDRQHSTRVHSSRC